MPLLTDRLTRSVFLRITTNAELGAALRAKRIENRRKNARRVAGLVVAPPITAQVPPLPAPTLVDEDAPPF